jgi:hypothetical protein
MSLNIKTWLDWKKQEPVLNKDDSAFINEIEALLIKNDYLQKELDHATNTLKQNSNLSEDINPIEVNRLALDFWQDNLAKFFPKQKEPTFIEYRMFYEGYRAGLKKTNE